VSKRTTEGREEHEQKQGMGKEEKKRRKEENGN
jgi:hypothetical protein